MGRDKTMIPAAMSAEVVSAGQTSPPTHPQDLGLQTHAPTKRQCHRCPRLCSSGSRGGQPPLQGRERNKSCKADTSAICAAHVYMCSCWTQQHADVACMQGYILLRSPPRKAILCCGRHRAKAIKNKFVGGGVKQYRTR